MTRTHLDHADCFVDLFPGFVVDHLAMMTTLLDELVLQPEELTIMGRNVLTPRLTGWFGDPGLSYRYSGKTFETKAFGPTLESLRDQVSERCGHPLNTVLVNYYRSGRDSMGYHADNERELGEAPLIASLSLGARRRFILRTRDRSDAHEWQLGEGDLLVMGGRTQAHYVHAVPKTQKSVGPRLNLTFRRILPDHS